MKRILTILGILIGLIMMLGLATYWRFRMTGPALVFNGDYDMNTANEHVQLSADRFECTQFVRFKHHGHAFVATNTCAINLWAEFINNKSNRQSNAFKTNWGKKMDHNLQHAMHIPPKKYTLQRLREISHSKNILS